MEDTKGIIARRDGSMKAMCVLDNWLEGSVQMHLVILDPTVLRRGFAQVCLQAAFGESRPLVLGWVPKVNYKARRFNKHLGFTEVCTLPEGFCPGVDYILMQLRREDCKYLGE